MCYPFCDIILIFVWKILLTKSFLPHKKKTFFNFFIFQKKRYVFHCIYTVVIVVVVVPIKMPHRLAKFYALQNIHNQLNYYLFLYDISYLMDWEEDYKEEVEFLYKRYQAIKSERYFSPWVHLKSTMRWEDLFYNKRWFDDNKFLAHFRMNRLMFLLWIDPYIE